MDNSRILDIIKESQDGKLKGKNDDFNNFILARISHNTDTLGETNEEDLLSDFKYFISELEKAAAALEKVI